VRLGSILFCAIAMMYAAWSSLLVRPSNPQNEPQHKLASVVPCPDDTNLPVNNIRLQSAAADVAKGALPWYEYKSAVIAPHDPASEKVTGAVHTIASIGPTCDGYVAMNISMHVLLENAFAIGKDYIVGAPSWTNDENYDVRIVFANETVDAINKLSPAMRIRAEHAALAPFFADTIKLAAHRELKQGPVYELVVGNKGPKFHESLYVNAATAGLTVFMDDRGGYVLTGRAARIDTLKAPLQKVLGREVLDRTGLTGQYDFVLTFDPQAQTFTSMSQMKPANYSPAAVYTKPVTEAIDKQLGLKLNSSKDSVEVISIDHIEKPLKN
jgi:uncharacterized protein (TIGR03435 family)